MTRKHHAPLPAAPSPSDDRLLHPGNEGHDEERERDRLERWASQEDTKGPDARALQALREAEGHAQALPIDEDIQMELPPPPPERGMPHDRDENAREHHIRGGEAKKHPRRPEETTPEPGRGPHHAHAMAGEPPDVRPTAGGVEYEPGRQPTVGRKSRDGD